MFKVPNIFLSLKFKFMPNFQAYIKCFLESKFSHAVHFAIIYYYVYMFLTPENYSHDWRGEG